MLYKMEMIFEVGAEVMWGVLVGGLIFLVLLIWFEFKKSKPWLYARCMAVFFAVTSICMLILKPSYSKKQENSVALLITEGSSPNIIDSLDKAYNPAFKVDLRALNQQEEVIEQLHTYEQWLIVGAKVPLQFSPFLKNKQVRYFPDGFISGWQNLAYPKNVQENTAWEFNGQYYSDSAFQTKLSISVAGKTLDSVVISRKGFSKINFKSDVNIPAGKYLFDLKVESRSVTNIEKLPVIITAKKTAKYLILSGFPSFEWKYLKDYLTDEGDAIFYRTKISQDKYSTEVINSATSKNINLNRDFLSQFDICLFDQSGWQDLNRFQKRLFKKLCEEEGLGLMLLTFGEKPKNIAYLNTTKWTTAQNTPFAIIHENRLVLTVLPEVSVRFTKSNQLESMLSNDKNESLVAYQQLGFGRQLLAVFPPLYPFILKGEVAKFENIYKNLIDRIQKPNFQEKYWDVNTLTNLQVDEKVGMTIHTTGNSVIENLTANVIDENNEKILLAPAQDALTAENFNYTFFPVKAGWQQVALVSDTAINEWFYVYPDNALVAFKRAKLITENLAKWENGNESADTFTSSEIKMWRKIPQWYFFTILLLSLSFLWLMDKIYS